MEELFRIPDKTAEADGEEGLRQIFRIGVAGGFPGAGASFTAGLIALQLASEKRSVCLCEPEGHYFYTALGMDRRFESRGFQSLVKSIESGRPVRHVKNTELGINWMLRSPDEKRSLSPAELFRLTAMPPGDICIIDCSGLSGDLLFGLLAETDCAVLVCDPLPTKLIPAFGSIERLRLSFPEAVMVADRMNGGVHRAELKRFLGGRSFIELPALPAEAVYRAEYNCVPVCMIPEIKKLLAGPCRELMEHIGV